MPQKPARKEKSESRNSPPRMTKLKTKWRTVKQNQNFMCSAWGNAWHERVFFFLQPRHLISLNPCFYCHVLFKHGFIVPIVLLLRVILTLHHVSAAVVDRQQDIMINREWVTVFTSAGSLVAAIRVKGREKIEKRRANAQTRAAVWMCSSRNPLRVNHVKMKKEIHQYNQRPAVKPQEAPPLWFRD